MRKILTIIILVGTLMFASQQSANSQFQCDSSCVSNHRCISSCSDCPWFDTECMGSCRCTVGGNRACGISSNNCNVAYNFVAECSTYNACNNTAASCTCVRVDPENDPNCGGTSQACCGGSICDNANLTCADVPRVGVICLDTGQTCAIYNIGCIQPGFSGEVFCDSNGNPSNDLAANFTRLTTAIGCIPYTNPGAIGAFFLTWLIGITGGLGLLTIIIGALLIMFSQGDKAKVMSGKEILFAGLTGTIMVVFSVYLLRIIGVDILQVLAP